MGQVPLAVCDVAPAVQHHQHQRPRGSSNVQVCVEGRRVVCCVERKILATSRAPGVATAAADLWGGGAKVRRVSSQHWNGGGTSHAQRPELLSFSKARCWAQRGGV